MVPFFFLLLAVASLFLAVGLHSKRMLVPLAANLIALTHPAYNVFSWEAAVQMGSALVCIAGFGVGAYLRAVAPEAAAQPISATPCRE